MKIVYALALATATVTSCSKEKAPDPHQPPVYQQPEMIYTNLQDRELKAKNAQLIDLNKDGTMDIGFSTWHIGDPLEKEEEILFFAGSYVHSSLLIGGINESPLFKTGELMEAKQYPRHEWYIVGQVEMAIKNIPLQGLPYWEGPWRLASHRYLAIRVNKQGLEYHGWIEVSFDTTGEKLILHKAAISKEPGKPVYAGK